MHAARVRACVPARGIMAHTKHRINITRLAASNSRECLPFHAVRLTVDGKLGTRRRGDLVTRGPCNFKIVRYDGYIGRYHPGDDMASLHFPSIGYEDYAYDFLGATTARLERILRFLVHIRSRPTNQIQPHRRGISSEFEFGGRVGGGKGKVRSNGVDSVSRRLKASGTHRPFPSIIKSLLHHRTRPTFARPEYL